MLTHLRLKNWRSLRDVEIADLTPITVFIGANSSGKTNILDALYFLRNIAEYGIVETVFTWGGRQKICSVNATPVEPIGIEFTYSSPAKTRLTKSIQIAFHESD
ncbi:MAG: AAA family ATPase [Chloroflexi bacterium]|nr:AAA family ATPase [Chloroflexota bacterium]